MLGQSVQSAFWHGIHGEWRCQGIDVQDVEARGSWFPAPTGGGAGAPAVNAGAGAEQGARPVGTLGDSNAELVARRAGHLCRHGGAPQRLMNTEPGADTRLSPLQFAARTFAQERLRRRQVVLTREQESDVDGDAGKIALLDGRRPSRCQGSDGGWEIPSATCRSWPPSGCWLCPYQQGDTSSDAHPSHRPLRS
jgi:hypothetical protein